MNKIYFILAMFFCLIALSSCGTQQTAETTVSTSDSLSEAQKESEVQSVNGKLMEAWKNRDSDSSSGTGGNGYGGSSLSESYLRGKAKQESETAASNVSSSPTLGEQNALRGAKDYIDLAGFSYKSLVEQLEYEGYSHEESVYGADNCGADWNTEAAESAKDYMDMTAFSRQGLIDQLLYEGYTQEQAEYGAASVGY